MKSKRNSSTWPSPCVAVAVGLLCLTYIQVSNSASITVASSSVNSTNVPPSNSSQQAISKRRLAVAPARISSLKTSKPKLKLDSTAGRMKASDIKACISKAFCEVNSASKVPNYAVNKEFFELMNKVHAELEADDVDSGSASAEYDDDDEDDDEEASSEESSSERLRGYPPPPRHNGYPPMPPPGYRYGRDMKTDNSTTTESPVNGTSTALPPKSKSSKKKVQIKKNGKKTKVSGNKTLKKNVKGTRIAISKRRHSRLETQHEKAQQQDYLTRKQREMGQVNDLAALIRISADIGLTLRNPRKCRTLFNKCTMNHDQIVDLFNQTLLAVTTPPSSNPAPSHSTSSTSSISSVTTTKRTKVTTSTASMSTSKPTASYSELFKSTPYLSEKPKVVSNKAKSSTTTTTTPTPTTTVSTTTTTQATTTTTEDVNRSSKSRHDFSDEDVEYMTDTEILPVNTYALFVNDAPEESVKTAEEVNLHETFKQYANAFPSEALLQDNLPALKKKKKNTQKSMKVSGRSKSTKRGHPSSEEEEEDDDEDDIASMSIENRSGPYSEGPYPPPGSYRGVKEDDAESGEPASIAKESTEGLPPLVQKEKPKKPVKFEEEEDDEDDSDESIEADEPKPVVGKGKSAKETAGKKKKVSGNKKKPVRAPVYDEASSEEDEVAQDDQQGPPPPWTPVYQMYMTDKKKQGHKKKQKGPYKGGEGPYADVPVGPPAHSHSSSSSGGMLSNALERLKKPWGGSSASTEIGGNGAGAPPMAPYHHSASQETPYEDAPYHHGGPPPQYGGPGSQEVGGTSEQKPGFFQSIMNWFTGSKNNEQNSPMQPDGPYGSPAPYGNQPHYGGGSAEHDYPMHDEPNKGHESATGAPWPNQPDPAGVGHFGQSYNNAYRYRNPESSEEDSIEEEFLEEPVQPKKKKRRFRGRSDSIITSPPKKSSPSKKSTAGSPPPPVVIIPKDSQSLTASEVTGIYEPNLHFEKLIQADTGSTSSAGKKKVVSSTKENKRTKKAAIKPKNGSNQTKSNKRKRKNSQRSSRESAEDDDEAFSSEELYNQQVAKLKSGSSIEIVSLGEGSSIKSGANSKNGGNNNKNSNKQSGSSSFPSYFDSMFPSQDKNKFQIKGKDDGSLLYGFDSLSSTLSGSPLLDLPIVPQKNKKPSTYKVNKNKTKQKKVTPVRFNNKEVVESSEEEDKKK